MLNFEKDLVFLMPYYDFITAWVPISSLSLLSFSTYSILFSNITSDYSILTELCLCEFNGVIDLWSEQDSTSIEF